MGAALAGVAVGGASPFVLPDHPDAHLLSLLARFDEIERHVQSLFAQKTNTLEEEAAVDAATEPFKGAQSALLDEACSLSAVTLDGFRARAASLLLWDGEMQRNINRVAAGRGDDIYDDDRMIAALVRDLTAQVQR